MVRSFAEGKIIGGTVVLAGRSATVERRPSGVVARICQTARIVSPMCTVVVAGPTTHEVGIRPIPAVVAVVLPARRSVMISPTGARRSALVNDTGV